MPTTVNHRTETTADLSAIILAAGFSGRMGRLKPLVPLGDRTLIERAVDLFRGAGIADISVVLGHRADEIVPLAAALGARVVINTDYPSGMFTSITRGIGSLPADCRAFFILPVDIPLVRPFTVRALIHTYRKRQGKIHYPVFNGRRGHPPLIHADLIPDILQWKGTGGLGGFLERHAAMSVDVPVPDEAVLMDMDTPADWRGLQDKLKTEDTPSPDECRVLLEEVQRLPAAVVSHCRTVARITRVLATAVNRAGGRLHVRRACAAARVHDVARLEIPHAERGADLLERLGYPQLADIVRVHMDIRVDERSPVDEREIVHLADKLVSGDRPVDLEQRFRLKMEKYGHDPEAARAIEHRKANACRIRAKVEKATGLTLAEILADAGFAPPGVARPAQGLPVPGAKA